MQSSRLTSCAPNASYYGLSEVGQAQLTTGGLVRFKSLMIDMRLFSQVEHEKLVIEYP